MAGDTRPRKMKKTGGPLTLADIRIARMFTVLWLMLTGLAGFVIVIDGEWKAMALVGAMALACARMLAYERYLKIYVKRG